MVEILLAKENKANSVELMSKINSISDSCRLFDIAENIDNIIKIFATHTIDIIVIEYNIFKKFNIIEFASIDKNVKYVIVIDNNGITDLDNINKDKYIFSNNDNLFTNLNNIIIKCRKNESDFIEFNIKKLIRNELKYLGYNLSYYGSKYLVDCIYYIYTQYNSFDENYIKDIYPILAKKYNKTPNNIKCNITRATSMMFCECEEKKLIEYLGTCSIPKTGSKIIIEAILNKIRYN